MTVKTTGGYGGAMKPLHAASSGLVLAGVGHLWYAGVSFQQGVGAPLWALLTGLALLQAAWGLGTEPPRIPVIAGGFAVAAFASWPDFRGILFQGYDVFSFAALLEGLGIVVAAVAALAWATRRFDDDLPNLVKAMRFGLVLTGVSGLIYLLYIAAFFQFLPPSPWAGGNVLIAAGSFWTASVLEPHVVAP